jgi:hypothetical protein
MADIAPAPRVVPGAPPPPPLSKSQKKKRKSVIKPKVADAPGVESMLSTNDSHTAASVEKLPEEVDDNKAAVAEAVVVAALEPIQEAVQDRSKKASPAVELLNKRIKVQTKKLVSRLMFSLLWMSITASMWGPPQPMGDRLYSVIYTADLHICLLLPNMSRNL